MNSVGGGSGGWKFGLRDSCCFMGWSVGPIRRSCNCAIMQSSGEAQVGHASYYDSSTVIDAID